MHRGRGVTHLGAHAQQPPQKEEVDLQLSEHVRQRTHLAQHLAHQPVRPRQRGVHLHMQKQCVVSRVSASWSLQVLAANQSRKQLKGFKPSCAAIKEHL